MNKKSGSGEKKCGTFRFVYHDIVIKLQRRQVQGPPTVSPPEPTIYLIKRANYSTDE